MASNYTLEELLKFSQEELKNYHNDFSRQVSKIQSYWNNIQDTIIRVNKIGIDYTCKICGSSITKENKYLWTVCINCKSKYMSNEKYSYGTYSKEKCDLDCKNCKYNDCISYDYRDSIK